MTVQRMVSLKELVFKAVKPTNRAFFPLYIIYYNRKGFWKQLYTYRPSGKVFKGSFRRYGAGRLRFVLPSKSAISFINAVYSEGLYERDFKLRLGMVVLDLGANSGLFSVYAAEKVGPEGKVLALEPVSANFKHLQENIALNRMGGIITPVNKGVGDRKESRTIFLSKEDFCHSIHEDQVPKDARRGKETIEIDTVEHILAESGIRPDEVDFVKLDVEGSELAALKGMGGVLESKKARIIVPDVKISSPEYEAIRKLLSAKGFQVAKSKGIGICAWKETNHS